MLVLCVSACGSNKNKKNIRAGMECIENADYESALACFDEGLTKGEDKELLLRGKGIAYIGLTRYEEAIEALIEGLSYCDGTLTDLEYDMNYYLALAYAKSGNYQEAYDTYCAILALKSKSATAYYLRGTVAIAMGAHDQAVADFDKAISLNKTDYTAYINIYQVLSEYGYEQEAKAYLEKAMSNGSKSMSDYNRGRICYYMGDYENACIYLDSANKYQTNEDTVLALGKAYQATGDINFAASIYVNYLANYGESAVIYNELGLCKLSTGDYASALEAFQNGIGMNNMDMMQSLKYNEVIACEYLGDFKRACVLMESYLAMYPDDEKALREYTFLKTR